MSAALASRFALARCCKNKRPTGTHRLSLLPEKSLEALGFQTRQPSVFSKGGLDRPAPPRTKLQNRCKDTMRTCTIVLVLTFNLAWPEKQRTVAPRLSCTPCRRLSTTSVAGPLVLSAITTLFINAQSLNLRGPSRNIRNVRDFFTSTPVSSASSALAVCEPDEEAEEPAVISPPPVMNKIEETARVAAEEVAKERLFTEKGVVHEKLPEKQQQIMIAEAVPLVISAPSESAPSGGLGRGKEACHLRSGNSGCSGRVATRRSGEVWRATEQRRFELESGPRIEGRYYGGGYKFWTKNFFEDASPAEPRHFKEALKSLRTPVDFSSAHPITVSEFRTMVMEDGRLAGALGKRATSTEQGRPMMQTTGANDVTRNAGQTTPMVKRPASVGSPTVQSGGSVAHSSTPPAAQYPQYRPPPANAAYPSSRPHSYSEAPRPSSSDYGRPQAPYPTRSEPRSSPSLDARPQTPYAPRADAPRSSTSSVARPQTPNAHPPPLLLLDRAHSKSLRISD
ncbi:hypothetical protein BDK51DRAFT_30420 [Blyttiomyces helicus]|uniref:Uncharacterized protein n=1 Tax=Blyttiomyces helicus TaxID=388810 RepID=A0A4P9WHY7_9FUNG|nr:hypothetical protein BDK51DRAFT_30420 [Blyttiomyces helicus]|eukprot:RKO90730.1 hypothetical protein BDK51DRAFT_30420 [Blyttiomyces helicus]